MNFCEYSIGYCACALLGKNAISCETCYGELVLQQDFGE